ncbi:MAG: PAS domain S-box protein [Gemmataceae bacterium]
MATLREQDLNRILDNLPDMVFRLDRDGRYRYVSPVVERHLGVAPSACIGKTIAESGADASLAGRIEAACGAALESAAPQRVEFSHTGPCGRVEFEGRIIPEFDDKGHVDSLLGIITDVTERRRSAREILRFKAVSDTANDVCFCADLEDARLTYFNRRAVIDLGFSEEELRGMSVRQIHAPCSEDVFLSWVKNLSEKKMLGPVEAHFRRKDGTTYPVELSLTLQEFDGRRHICGVARDMTERKRTERRAQESERRYAALAELTPLLVWTADAQGNFDFVNQRWHDYTGVAGAALKDWGWTDLLHAEDRDATLHAWREALRRGEAVDSEYRLRSRQGVYQWFLARAIPVRDEGRIVKWFGACTNIDRQKQGEEALKEADRRKDEFLAMLSHELRNPLAAIRNAMHLFDVQRLGDATLLEARAVLDRQSQILSGLVDDLLDVFRIRHQKIALRPETLDLAHLARLTLGDLQSAFDGIGLTINADIPDRPIWVRADRIRLSQVLMNLLNNAAKFSKAGGRITLRLLAEDERAVVQVRDTGIGIAPEMLPHVFDTFCQADPDLARSRGGLGLGLALVKGLVQLHGGDVQASSAGLGRGAAFSFWLALVPAPSTEPATAPAPTSRRTLRVLIIEDNRDTARTLGILLRRYGHQVEVAHSGTQGVAKAHSWKPEVVLCDLGLPEIDGFEVARRLRPNPDLAGTRLIAVSGYGQEEDRRRSEQAGFDLHLTKPVDPVELQRLLTVLKVG